MSSSGSFSADMMMIMIIINMTFSMIFFMECHRVADGGISYNKIIDISYLARIHLNLVSS